MVPDNVQAKASQLVNAFSVFVSEVSYELGKLFEKPASEPTPDTPTVTPETNQDPPEVLAQATQNPVQATETENPTTQEPSEFEGPNDHA